MWPRMPEYANELFCVERCMEVHAVETVIELIRCGFSTDLEGTLFSFMFII